MVSSAEVLKHDVVDCSLSTASMSRKHSILVPLLLTIKTTSTNDQFLEYIRTV